MAARQHDCFLDLSIFRKNHVLTKTGCVTCAFLRVEVKRSDLKHTYVLDTFLKSSTHTRKAAPSPHKHGSITLSVSPLISVSG